jgi:hypothetical protein
MRKALGVSAVTINSPFPKGRVSAMSAMNDIIAISNKDTLFIISLAWYST